MILKTNIPKLDEMLGGGLRSEASTLISSSPGIRSLQFLHQIIYSRLKQGDKVFYLAINKKPQIIRKQFRDYDWDISSFEKSGKFVFVDVYQKIMEKKSFDDLSRYVYDFIGKLKSRGLFAIDSLSSFLDIYGTSNEVMEFIKKISNSYKDMTMIAMLVEWPYKKSIISKLRDYFDCVINLKSIEKDIILRKYFTVSKANWIKRLQRRGIMFDVLYPGGVREYVPKILVTGPYNSGKSTFTHAISTKATSVDRLGTTVALDYGHVDYKEYVADVFGTPGQIRFDPLLNMLGHRAIGLFLVIDSTRPETFARAEEMISRCNASKLPYIVIANKQDLKSALSVNQIRKRLSLPKTAKIIPCIAVRKKGLNRALDALFNEIGG
ncbi:MAG: ATPase domain-containing protein [Nanoarchaeota archaeon]